MQIKQNESLAHLSYYKIGGTCSYYCEPQSLDDLKQATDFLKSKKLSFYILGAGSNLLISDENFNGMIISTSKLNSKLELETGALHTGCSVKVIQVLRLAMKEGLKDLGFMAGIPGSMGGVFAMNAGTKLGEVKDHILSMQIYNIKTGKLRDLPASQLTLSYRKNASLDPFDLVYSGVLKTERTDPLQIQNEITELLSDRKKSQPIDKPSCGSVFKNPDPKNKIYSWKLISEAGLRGHTIGGAQISALHTNFIVNLGNAKAQDVKDLIALAKEKVFEKSGYKLEEEVRFLSNAESISIE